MLPLPCRSLPLFPPSQIASSAVKRRDRVQYPNLFPAGGGAKRKSGCNEIVLVRTGLSYGLLPSPSKQPRNVHTREYWKRPARSFALKKGSPRSVVCIRYLKPFSTFVVFFTHSNNYTLGYTEVTQPAASQKSIPWPNTHVQNSYTFPTSLLSVPGERVPSSCESPPWHRSNTRVKYRSLTQTQAASMSKQALTPTCDPTGTACE